MCASIALAGAGIYGATVAIRLAEHGHHVRRFDPLGILRAASAINQYRVHAGYHYPRSLETIQPDEAIPESYAGILNEPEFRPVPFTRFEAMQTAATRFPPRKMRSTAARASPFALLKTLPKAIAAFSTWRKAPRGRFIFFPAK